MNKQTEMSQRAQAKLRLRRVGVLIMFLISGEVIGDTEALRSTARNAIENGQFARAIVRLENVPPGQRTEADNLALAQSYLRVHDLDRAEKLAKDLLRRSPANDEAMLVLGDVAADRNDWRVALKWYIQASRAQGAPPVRWLRVGQALQHLNKPEEAEQAFGRYRKLSGLEPHNK